MSDIRILLTGATGSFGRALARHLVRTMPGVHIIGMSRDECKQADLIRANNSDALEYILGDVRNPPPLPKVDLIVHAAALKHVGRAEEQPDEVVKTNVLGTQNMIAHARDCDCPIIALSTDKACCPINAYGASKLLMEKLVLAAGGTIVRYGNVIGSRGSLIPFVLNCVNEGKSIPITDGTMTRFWLPLSAAVELVKDAWYLQNIYSMSALLVPRARSMTIGETVTALAPGHPTHVIGPMPGEKRHEMMLSVDETANCYVWRDNFVLCDDPQAGPDTPTVKVDAPFAYTSENAERMTATTLRDYVNDMVLVGNQLVERG